MKLQIRGDLPSDGDFMSVNTPDHITLLHSGSLSRLSRQHLYYLRHINAGVSKNDNGKHKCQNKIKKRTCKDDRKSGPHSLAIERSLGFILRILSYHGTGTSDWKQLP